MKQIGDRIDDLEKALADLQARVDAFVASAGNAPSVVPVKPDA